MRRKKVALNLKIKPHLNELIVQEASEQGVSKTEILERCVQSYFLGKEGASRSAVQTVFQPVTSSSRAENQLFIELRETLEKQTENFASLGSVLEQLNQKLEGSTSKESAIIDGIYRQTQALEALTESLNQTVIQTDKKTETNTPPRDTKKRVSKGKEKAPKYRYKGKSASIKEHLLNEFPDLSGEELRKAKNNVNRSIKGRGDKPGKKPAEAISRQVELLNKKGGEGYA